MLRPASLQRVQVEVIFTELDLVGTFLRISRTSRQADTQQRNRMLARNAYATARRYASRLTVSSKLQRTIDRRFTEAELDLRAAGEPVD